MRVRSRESSGIDVLAAAVFWVFSGAQAKADLAPATCTAGSNGSDAVLQASSPGPFAVGERMGYRVLLTNPTLDQFLKPGCTISNAFVNLRMPTGEIIAILTNIVLLPGEQIICPGSAQCLSTGRTGLIGAQLFYTNIVTAGQVTFIDPTIAQCPPAPGANAIILAFTMGGAIVLNTPGGGFFGTATYNRCSTLQVTPCLLSVAKRCVVPQPPQQPFDCSGAKPITSMTVLWNSNVTIYVRAWNGSI